MSTNTATQVTVGVEAEQAVIDKARAARGEAPQGAAEEKPAEAAAAATPAETTAVAPETTAPETPDPIVTDEGVIDFEALSMEWAQSEDGRLSEDSYAKAAEAIEKAGLPTAVLDAHIQGLNAIRELAQRDAYEVVGGKQAYADMIAWAGKSLSKEDAAAFDQAVSSSSAQAKFAIQGLFGRYSATKPQAQQQRKQEPSVRTAGAARGQVGGPAPIGSRQAFARLVSDPRYATDPAFRAAAQESLKAAMESGEYRPHD